MAENVEDVLNELIRIENSLAFIRSSSTHHSMLSIDEIDNMIGRLTKIYKKEQIIELERRQYYDIIRPGYYYYNKQIVIVFKLPIASVDYFDTYKLAIFPNKNMQALLPPSPYTLTNRRKFMYIEAECPKFNNKWYLCEEKNNQLRTSPDCTQNLIFNQTMDHTCEMTTITLSQEAMEELDSRHYIISFPHPTRIHTACEREDFVTLNGSFLATIPANCILSTNIFVISNIEDKIAGQPLKILDVNYEKELHQVNSDNFKLKSINLKSLYSIQDRAMVQPILPLKKAEASTIYHTTIPFYVTLSSTLALISGILIVRRYGHFCYKPKSKNTEIIHNERNHQDQNETENCSKEGQFPATFFHSILK